MDVNPQEIFVWVEHVGEPIAEGSLPWVLGAWLVVTFIALQVLWIVRRSFNWLHRRVAALLGGRIRAIRYRGQELFSQQEVTLIVLGLLRFV